MQLCAIKISMATIGKDLQKAIQLLENGEVIGLPTETVYGLAGNALRDTAISKIFSVKDRPFFDPLIVHVHSLDSARDYVEYVPSQAEKLAEKFWPGPLTLLLKKKKNISDLVTAGLDRVGIRCPNHSLTQQLLKQLSFPLAAPSANPFGYVSPTTAQHVEDQLGEKIPYILDGGVCQVGIESTIIGWENGKPIVYRMGGVTLEDIESCIGKVTIQPHSTSRPQAPGQLKNHYAPHKTFLLGDIQLLIKQQATLSRVGILSFQNKAATISPSHQLVLSPSGDLNEAGRNIFSVLRQFDAMDIDTVLAEEVPNIGLGRAINDRLRRAAARD